MLLAKITNLLLLAILTLSTVTTYASGSVMNGKPLDPKEFACGNKQADPIECVSYQGGQLLTGAILTKAIGLVIPKGTTTKVSGVTQGIDDLKKVGNYVDDVDDVKVNKGNTGTDIDGIPCVSDSGNQNKSFLDYALVIIGVKGLSVEAGCVKDIDFNQQDKHIVGKNAYNNLVKNGSSPSVLTADPKSLLNKLGSGKQVGDLKIKLGDPGSKEIIDFGYEIGKWSNLDGSETLITTKATVHYSKNGVHFVPAYPN